MFVLTTWVLPYPTQHLFWAKGPGKQRRWLSVFHPLMVLVPQDQNEKCRWADLLPLLGDRFWTIGRKRFQTNCGSPSDNPNVTEMSVELLEEQLRVNKEEAEARERARQRHFDGRLIWQDDLHPRSNLGDNRLG